MKSIAYRIIKFRRKAGMSQAQLARKLNVSPSALGNYEQGRRIPSVDLLVQMSQIFDISLDYLITGAEHGETIRAECCPCDTCYWKEYRTLNNHIE